MIEKEYLKKLIPLTDELERTASAKPYDPIAHRNALNKVLLIQQTKIQRRRRRPWSALISIIILLIILLVVLYVILRGLYV